MEGAPRHVSSRRSLRLAERFRNPKYRHGYVESHTKQFLARQMRELRGELSQEQFGKLLDMKQNVVSRLEDPGYGRWTLSTLLAVAKELDIALFCRFVSFDTFRRLTEEQSDDAAAPPKYDEETDVAEPKLPEGS